MPSSMVQHKAKKDVVPLKPIQPTQLWTFEGALSILKSGHDSYMMDALDEFLILNSSVLLSPLPFKQTSKDLVSIGTKDISIRDILYSDVTKTNIKDSHKVSDYLQMDNKEALRVINQICKRIPEKKLKDSNDLKSKLPDEREKHMEKERILLYSRHILKERRVVLKLVIELLNNKTDTRFSNVVQNLGKEIYLSKTYALDCIANLNDLTRFLMDESYKTGISEELEELIYNETVLTIINILKVLIELLVQSPGENLAIMKAWFEFVGSLNFFNKLGPFFTQSESFNLVYSLSTMICVVLIDLENFSATYLSNIEIFKTVNDAIVDDANINSIVMYCWAIILLRKSYILEASPLEASSVEFMTEFDLNYINEVIRILNERCLKLNVYQELSNLNGTLKFDNIYSAILSSIIISAMPIISINADIASTISNVMKNAPHSIVEKFFEDESTKNAIVVTRVKFPIDLYPYLKLATVNGNFAFHEFNDLKTYSYIFDKSEFERLYEIDDQNTELVKIKEMVNLYPPYESNKKLSFLLSVGTRAKILPSSDPNKVIVSFIRDYNGWGFLGRVIQNVSKFFDSEDVGKVQFIIDILNLLTKVVEDNSTDVSCLVFESLSLYTDGSDILEIILRLFEQGLHSRNIPILESVLNLLTNIMPIMSDRIWPYISKSALISDGGKEGFASTIFGAIEMINGDYSFSVSLIKFTDALVKNCISIDKDYSENSKSKVLTKFITHLLLVFESFVHCKFSRNSQKMEMAVLILDIFSNILATVHGIDEDCEPSKKVTRVFAESSKKILNSFLIPSDDYSRTTYPILSMIDTLSKGITVFEISDTTEFWHINWIKCSLSFSQLVVTIRSALKLAPSGFERSLFSKLPSLVSIYNENQSLRKDVLDLITSLTEGEWFKEQKPSLLSHLGRDYAQVLLHSIASDLENSVTDYKLKISLYDFICAVMNGKQEGLSVLFISGRDVFGDFSKDKDEKKTETKHISLLNNLKKNVREMKYYPNSVSLHLTDAISMAFNSWTTTRENDEDAEFLDELISRVASFKKIEPKSTEQYIFACYEFKLISKILEILALYLFTTKNKTYRAKIVDMMSTEHFNELVKTNFTIHGYKSSLHANAQSSFENLSYHLKLSQFNSALSKRNRYGTSSVYNLYLMDSLFQNKTEWPQVRERIIASSVNLQHLNCQISVAKSLGALLTAYCRRYDPSANVLLMDVVYQLLKTNSLEGIPSQFFEGIYQERIELSFFIFYTLYVNNSMGGQDKIIFEIIKICADILSSPSMNFLGSLAKGSGYYRPCLRIIYCALSSISESLVLVLEHLSVFRDLFDLTITRGIKILSAELQNDIYLSKSNQTNISDKLNDKIDDFMLILSILEVFMKLKKSSSLNYEMEQSISNHDCVHHLLNLYSFSHLIEVKEEHIFAQISLMFIQELMSIEVVAEKFVSTGLFIVMAESKVSSPIRAGGLNTTSTLQFHKIWNSGILPIFLMALHKLDPDVVPEICTALTVFGKQIESCIDSWSKDSSSLRVTSALVSETSQLVLLFQMLSSYNVQEYLVQDFDSSTPNTVDMSVLPGLDSEAKREDFLNCVNNLLKHPKFLSSRVFPCSLEEKTFIEKDEINFDLFLRNLVEEIRDFKDSLS